MADKSTALSIVIRTVDQATAKIQAINARLTVLTKPIKDFGKATGDLREHLKLLGYDAVRDGVKGVGSAVTDLLGKVAMVGGVLGGFAGLAVTGLLSLVDHYDKLGDTAERLGTSADFLAAFRYAAERAGAPLEGVDEALQTLVTNMGAAKAGTGKMLKFLNEISPALAKQVTAAHSLEEALGLLADAEAKLPDAARRDKLAAATLGNPALAPLLAKGSKGVQEFLTEYHALAGAQGEAAEAAGKTDDALKKLHASTDGVKAALVTGLSPALTEIIDKLTKWLVARRPDVEKWAAAIGKELPAAFDKAITWLDKTYDKAAKLIEQFGGIQTVALAVAAAITGPLIASIITLGIAMMSSPAGLVLAGLGALALGIAHVVMKPPEEQPESVTSMAATGGEGYSAGAGFNAASDRNELPRTIAREAATLPTVEYPLIPQQQAPTATLKVDFMNVPKGTRVTADPSNTTHVDMTTGYQMMGFGT